MGLSYGVLGPLEVHDGTRPVPLTRAKDRLLLAALLIDANHVVSTDRLVDVLWGERPPASGLKALHFHISSLRTALRPERGRAAGNVLTRSPGYVLEVADEDVDVHRFRRLVDHARRVMSFDNVEALRWLEEALALWRGPPYEDFTYEVFAAAEIKRLAEERLEAIEMRYEVELALGRHDEAIPSLSAHATEHPNRERLHALLITALYRSGRQVDALDAYQSLRVRLRDELGLDPSPELVALESDVLRQSASLRAVQTKDHRPEGIADLPTHLTTFIGRAEELAQLTDLVACNRLVTVIGPGGAGKTRLAVEAASTPANTEFDRVAFVDLAAVTDETLVDLAVLAALGASEAPNRSIREALDDHLAEQNVLIVLDNCEHVVAAAASVAGHILAMAPGVRVLATSQQVLRLPGERRYLLPPMTASASTAAPRDTDRRSNDAIDLFVDRAERARPGFVPSPADVDLIAAIADRLDGLPLAIELAAARARTMTVAEIATALTDRVQLSTDGQAEVTRQSTLEAALTWSYELTQGRERALFDMLSVFVGPFTRHAAAAVDDLDDPAEVAELLGRLVDKSLLAVDASGDEIRYRLLETLRAFGATRLDERGDAAIVAERHATHHLDIACRGNELLSGSDQSRWQRQFRQSAPDTRAALEWSLDHHPDQALAAVANGLGAYWSREASHTEATFWLERALAAADPGPSAIRASALKSLAAALFFSGRIEAAHAASTEAVAIAREAADARVLCAALSMVGTCAWHQGRLPEAIASFEEAVEVTVDAGNPAPAAVLWNIGISYLDLTDIGGADKTARRLRESEATGGEPLTSMNADFLESNIALVRGELADARSLAESALVKAAELDRPFDIAEVHERLAEISVIEGDLDAVDRHLDDAAALRADLSPRHQSRANLVRARRALATGDLDAAREALRDVLTVALERRQPAMESTLIHETARLAYATGELLDATVLCGALRRLAGRPEVTLAAFIATRSAEMEGDLAAMLGADQAQEAGRRGEAMHVDDVFGLIAHCLDVDR